VYRRSDGRRAEDYTFFYGKGNEDQQLGAGFFVHKRNISAVRRVEFVSDRMSYDINLLRSYLIKGLTVPLVRIKYSAISTNLLKDLNRKKR
jgi:hypothetical protein